ncbi:HAD family hydrolase [soil metagenome]
MCLMLRAVLFDLDDTLFDHSGCARGALEAVHGGCAALSGIPFDEFELAHARILEALHLDVLAGRRGIDDAREERFRRLIAESGAAPDGMLARGLAARYRDRYVAERRALAGAAALLEAVRAHAAIGIVTNNLRDEQVAKIRNCGLDVHLDVLVVSEEAGVSKPDPAIFQVALDRLGCAAPEAVMVGDSWPADILGARAAGIPAIWFNPAGAPAPDPDVPVLRGLTPADAAVRAIFDAHRR